MRDPLAGQRESINQNEIDTLVWPDTGRGCPVKVGDSFKLRACTIEITRIQRRGPKGAWVWIAEFRRLLRDKVHLLAANLGYITKPVDSEAYSDAVLALDDAAWPTGSADQEVVNVNFGHYPPEPEMVDPRELGDFTGDRDARARHDDAITEARMALDKVPIEERVRRVMAAAENGAPVGRQVRAILGKVAEAERKVGVRRAA